MKRSPENFGIKTKRPLDSAKLVRLLYGLELLTGPIRVAILTVVNENFWRAYLKTSEKINNF